MGNNAQVGRRTWLTHIALGSFAVWSELNFGLGRRGWGVAIGGRDFAISVAHAQNPGRAELLRVSMGRVNGYVLVRSKEAALVDTGTPGNASKFADVIRAAGLGWDAVQHVILTHYHTDHIGSVGDILEAAPKATVYAGGADITRIDSYVYPPPSKPRARYRLSMTTTTFLVCA
jgi:glyoxylase-like metal-dependent hydrolase (beta-lactamase superfamily II)